MEKTCWSQPSDLREERPEAQGVDLGEPPRWLQFRAHDGTWPGRGGYAYDDQITADRVLLRVYHQLLCQQTVSQSLSVAVAGGAYLAGLVRRAAWRPPACGARSACAA